MVKIHNLLRNVITLNHCDEQLHGGSNLSFITMLVFSTLSNVYTFSLDWNCDKVGMCSVDHCNIVPRRVPVLRRGHRTVRKRRRCRVGGICGSNRGS